MTEPARAGSVPCRAVLSHVGSANRPAEQAPSTVTSILGNLANQSAEPILPPQRLGYRAARDVVSPGQGG
jgi:hypothetical protein